MTDDRREEIFRLCDPLAVGQCKMLVHPNLSRDDVACPHCRLDEPVVSYLHASGEPWKDGKVEAFLAYDRGYRLVTCVPVNDSEVYASVGVSHCPKCGRKL